VKKKLLQIYDHFDTWAGDFDFACTRGCATCCTQSVTMTTLEGELIADFIRTSRPELLPLLDELPRNNPETGTTTNEFAAACLRGEVIGEEAPAWDLAPCVFLQDECCTIYPVRSFMCRSFGSRVRCDPTGTAEIEPLFLTLNTVIMQCIEHLDRGRPWGNMNAVLRSIADRKEEAPQCLAQRIPGFLIPPEETDKLSDQLQILLHLLKEDH